MNVQFIQDLSITALGGWKRVGEVLDTDESMGQWLIDSGYAVAVEEGAPPVADDSASENIITPGDLPTKSKPAPVKRKTKK